MICLVKGDDGNILYWKYKLELKYMIVFSIGFYVAYIWATQEIEDLNILNFFEI